MAAKMRVSLLITLMVYTSCGVNSLVCYHIVVMVSKVAEMFKVSMIFEQTVRLASNPQLIFCIGKVKVVSVNDQMKPCRINPKFVEKICYDT